MDIDEILGRLETIQQLNEKTGEQITIIGNSRVRVEARTIPTPPSYIVRIQCTEPTCSLCLDVDGRGVDLFMPCPWCKSTRRKALHDTDAARLAKAPPYVPNVYCDSCQHRYYHADVRTACPNCGLLGRERNL